MQLQSILLALLASSTTVLSLPLPQEKTVCVGSSFSPTNCDSPGGNSINVIPSIDIGKRQDDDSGDTTVGSSFSPTNNDSPGANSINVDPSVTADPTVEIGNGRRDAEAQDSTCVGSSFSPTNCDSPGANSINVDPNIDVSPNVDLGSLGSLLGGRS